MLRAIYADLRCIGDHVGDDVVLHAAERELPGMKTRYVGRAEVIAKELDLIRLTDDTLVMDVQDMQANDHYGAVNHKLQHFETKELVPVRLMPILKRIWAVNFNVSGDELLSRQPALDNLANQIARFFGPEAQPQVRSS